MSTILLRADKIYVSIGLEKSRPPLKLVALTPLEFHEQGVGKITRGNCEHWSQAVEY